MIIFTPNTVIRSTDVNSNFNELDAKIADNWTTWTPTWSSTGTQPSLGDGTLTAKYMQIGKIVFVTIRFVAGATTTFGSGSYRLTYPVTPTSAYSTNNAGWCLSGYSEDAGLVTYTVNGTRCVSLTTFAVSISSPISASADQWRSIGPFTWGTGDFWSATGFYEAA
jgi:hypothetical protein